jgi:diguanylate cyclase (GGDEF)-like protein/PAS domain S-box-containing protein
MKQYTHRYIDADNLDRWLDNFKYKSTDSILIQLFSGVVDTKHINSITSYILQKIPSCTIVGATSSGEIINDEIIDNSIIISLSIFESTQLKSIEMVGNDYENIANNISKEIICDDTKCIIMFADGIKFNPNMLLTHLQNSCRDDIIIMGGIAGDNNNFLKTYCIHNNFIFENGVVAVSLSNPNLKIFTDYSLNWKPIGTKMTITKSDKNILYEIDKKPIKDIYAKYLGKNILQNIPASILEFPLMGEELCTKIARAMVSSTKDGAGIIYGGGEFYDGEDVSFGVISPDLLIENAKRIYQNSLKHPIESFFTYSCVSNKVFSKELLKNNFSPLSKIAPISGFFTYGEFFHTANKNKLLNLTTTIIGLSENDNINKQIKHEEFINTNFAIDALTHLVDVTLQEKNDYAEKLFQTNKALKLKNKALNVSANAIVITDIQGNILWANNAYTELTGYTISDYLGKNPKNIVNSNMHNNEFFKNLWDTILSNRVWHGEIQNKRKDGTIYREEMTITPMSNEYGVIEYFVAVKQDITERKVMEAEIEKLAFYDNLTGLANRKLLFDRLEKVQSLSQRSNKYFALLFLDLDNFKPLNDECGHSAGDLLLKETAKRLLSSVRKVDTISRFGGDEFVILLSELDKDKEIAKEIALNVAKKIKAKMSEPYSLTFKMNGAKMSIKHKCTASIGVSVFLSHELSCEEMMIKADTAMYMAKKMGKDSIKHLD